MSHAIAFHSPTPCGFLKLESGGTTASYWIGGPTQMLSDRSVSFDHGVTHSYVEDSRFRLLNQENVQWFPLASLENGLTDPSKLKELVLSVNGFGPQVIRQMFPNLARQEEQIEAIIVGLPNAVGYGFVKKPPMAPSLELAHDWQGAIQVPSSSTSREISMEVLGGQQKRIPKTKVMWITHQELLNIVITSGCLPALINKVSGINDKWIQEIFFSRRGASQPVARQQLFASV